MSNLPDNQPPLSPAARQEASNFTLGVVMGWRRRVGWALDPLMVMLYASPLVALSPLIVIFFGVGMAANARQPSGAGSYSHASLTGLQPGGPAAGRSKPPNKYIFPFSAVTAA